MKYPEARRAEGSTAACQITGDQSVCRQSKAGVILRQIDLRYDKGAYAPDTTRSKDAERND